MFDATRFNATPATLRTADYEIKALAGFFEEDQPPIFRVRQLTGEELAACQEAAKVNRDTAELITGLMADDPKEKVEAVLTAMGRSQTKVPDEHAKRLEMLVLGSVEPKLDRSTVINLATRFPVDFMILTNMISGLSGQGAILGESSGSGATPASGRRARSGGESKSRSMN